MMQSVQVIIERLKSHPEDFFGDLQGDRRTYSGSFPKFQDIVEKLDDLLLGKPDAGHIHRLWYLEPEEQQALLAAYKEARRARFEANVFNTLLTKQEEVPVSTVTERMSSSGKRLMSGWSDARGMWQGAVPKAEGATIVDHINNAFDKEYAKNSNPRS